MYINIEFTSDWEELAQAIGMDEYFSSDAIRYIFNSGALDECEFSDLKSIRDIRFNFTEYHDTDDSHKLTLEDFWDDENVDQYADYDRRQFIVDEDYRRDVIHNSWLNAYCAVLDNGNIIVSI